MIERIGDLPESVVGFVAKGKVSSDDYQGVLIPAVDEALEMHDKLRLLYVLGGEFDGMTAGAMWDDTRSDSPTSRSGRRSPSSRTRTGFDTPSTFSAT
jgi:hypothetical protein